MKSKKLLLPFMLLLMMTLSLSSCGDYDEPYYSPLIGSWELLEDQYGVVPYKEVNRFHFYSDGRGAYEAYDDYGYWTNWRYWWDEYGKYDNLVEITFEDGTTWTYYWEIHRGYLYLYDYWNTDIYLIYRPLY